MKRFGFGLGIGSTIDNGDLISWTNPDGNILIEGRGTQLTANGGAIDWPNRVAYTEQTYGEDDLVEFYFVGGNDAYVGLSDNTMTSFGAMNYGILVEVNLVRVYESGNFQAGGGSTAWSASDKYGFKIVDIGGGNLRLKYYRNGVEFYESATIPSGLFRLRTTFYETSNSTVEFETF